MILPLLHLSHTFDKHQNPIKKSLLQRISKKNVSPGRQVHIYTPSKKGNKKSSRPESAKKKQSPLVRAKLQGGVPINMRVDVDGEGSDEEMEFHHQRSPKSQLAPIPDEPAPMPQKKQGHARNTSLTKYAESDSDDEDWFEETKQKKKTRREGLK